MKKAEQVVFESYDDPSMSTVIRELIEAVGLSGQTFGSGQELLKAKLPNVSSCLVLDVLYKIIGIVHFHADAAGTPVFR
jgi:FixJ family two-component response regulator